MINLYNEDCLKAMKKMDDNSYDLAIVDPPYGIGLSGGAETKYKNGKNEKGFTSQNKYKNKNWDKKRPSPEYFTELLRVSKNQVIWGGNYFSDLLPISRGWIYWDKKITNVNNYKFSNGELAWTSFDCILQKFTYDWIGFGYINNPQKERKIHPTQKPVALYTWILNNYAKPGDKILDTHLGSGSIAIACHNLGFDLDGYKLDVDYFEAATKRLKEHQRQLKLF